MAFPFAAAVPFVASAIGGLFGRSGDREQRLATERANEQNLALRREEMAAQREFAQYGIRWRVEDAKAAGLHPLYALGGVGPSYSPSGIQVMPDQGAGSWQRDMGQNVARAAAAFETPTERAIKSAQLKALEAAADKDFAAATAYRSEAARNLQQSNPSVAESFPVALPGQTVDSVSVNGGPYQSVNEYPLPPLAPVAPYLAENGKVTPGLQRFALPIVGEALLPAGSSLSEAMESLENPINQRIVFAFNVKHYGRAHAERIMEELLPHRLREMTSSKWWRDPFGALGDKLDTYRR